MRRKPWGENKGEEQEAGQRWKKTKKRAEGIVAATRGGDLWWDYRWRYFFITVSPGRLALFSSSSRLGCPPRPFGDGFLLGSARLAPAGLTARSFFGTAYISRNVGNVHAPARERVQLAGGCILITFMSSDIPSQIYCPGTRGFCEDLEPERLCPSPRVPPFLRSLVLRFLRFSRPRDHPLHPCGLRNQLRVPVLPSL